MANEAKQQFQCTGNCLNCIPNQRAYCASQHAYSNMRVLDKVMETLTEMREQISAMQGEVKEMAARIEAIQYSDGDIFDPTTTYAQEGDGAEIIEPQDSLTQKQN